MMKSLILCSTLLLSPHVLADCDYEFVWGDEFDYKGLPDPSKWTYESGNVRNKELQHYQVADLANSWVNGEHLNIRAIYHPQSDVPYTSASLTTEKIKDWTYGRFEIRAQLPTVEGTWPALWMLGSNIREIYWPRAGEIDIMEHVSKKPGVLHSNTVYFDYQSEQIKRANGGQTKIEALDGFNVYRIDWDEESIEFYLNDEKYHTFEISKIEDGNSPFDKPFYLIMNLAVGGWAGEPKRWRYPATLKVDYVRTYQKTCS